MWCGQWSSVNWKKYRSRNLEDLCDVDSDPLMQEISNSLNAEAFRLLTAIIRNGRHKPRGRRWNFEEKIWLCLYLSLAQNHILLFFHQDAPCNPSSILFLLGLASIPMYLMHFVTLCRKCLKKTGTLSSCLTKCRSERMYGLIRNLSALRHLIILEVTARCGTLQTMLYFSWSVVCTGSGSTGGLLPQSWKY